jgi:hypothetical protein
MSISCILFRSPDISELNPKGESPVFTPVVLTFLR